MIHTILSAIWGWLQSVPLVNTLLMLMVLDVLSGLFVAFSGSNLCSTISWRGMSKKAQTLIMVALGFIMDPVLVKQGLPPAVGSTLAVFFILTEVISIIENAALSGLPIPGWLVDGMVKMRQQVGIGTGLPGASKTEVKVTVTTPEPHVPTNVEALEIKAATAPVPPEKVPVPLVALVGISLLFLTGCGTALQPYLRVDREGYEGGVKGTWRGVADESRKIVQGATAGDGKAVAR